MDPRRDLLEDIERRRMDEHDKRLATLSVFLDAKDAVFEEGEAGECHENAHKLMYSDNAALVGTGWALSEDGLWRQHSWAHRVDGTLLETTEARIAYFGTVCDCAPCLLQSECFE